MYYAPFDDWRRIDVASDHTGRTWAEGVRRLVEEVFPAAQRDHAGDGQLEHPCGGIVVQGVCPGAARALTSLEFVYTPKHGSWLNMAECEFSVLARQCLDRRIADVETLGSKRLDRGAQSTNKPVEWRFTTADARDQAAPPISHHQRLTEY